MEDQEQETGPKYRARVRRHVVVGRLLAMYENPRYLEIGVCEGLTFDRVAAPLKVAVDPQFVFDHEDPDRQRPGTEYHQVTSDDYFGTVVEPDQQFDVIFLDGLHTVEQTLRDLANALHHLQPQGVILVDDVRPPTYLASLPSRENHFAIRRLKSIDDPDWMGDVYRLVYFVETFFQQLSFRTISNNHGQAVIWRKRRESVPDRSLTEVGSLTFEDFLLSEETLRLEPLGEILRQVRKDLGLPKDAGGGTATDDGAAG